MTRLMPKDAVAIIALVAITILKLSGQDGELDAAAALILGYYFAHRKNGTDAGT